MATTITSPTSSAVTLAIGDTLFVSGYGLATFGPGPQYGQMSGIAGQATFGPYPDARVINLCASGTDLSYYTDSPDAKGTEPLLRDKSTSALDTPSMAALKASGLCGYEHAFFQQAGSVSRCSSLESVVVPQNTTVTLIDTTATPGPGIVDSIDLIVSVPTGARDAYFRIYIDGASTPISIQGHHFGTFYQSNSATFFNTKHLFTSANSHAHIGCKYPIPYKQSIKIVYDTALCGSGVTIYTNIEYTTGVSYPWKFGFSGMGYDAKQTFTPTQQGNRSAKFLDLPYGSGNTGFIAGFTLIGANSTNTGGLDTWLENNIVVYQESQLRDGSVVPAFNNTGTEDFFKAQWYFELGMRNYQDVFLSSYHLGSTNSSNITVHRDLMSQMNGLKFSDGCLFTMEQGLASIPGTSTTTIDMFWGVWYYLRG